MTVGIGIILLYGLINLFKPRWPFKRRSHVVMATAILIVGYVSFRFSTLDYSQKETLFSVLGGTIIMLFVLVIPYFFVNFIRPMRPFKSRGGAVLVAVGVGLIVPTLYGFLLMRADEMHLANLKQNSPDEYRRVMAERALKQERKRQEARERQARAVANRKAAAERRERERLARARANDIKKAEKERARLERERCQDEVAAFTMAETFVERRLKAPKTSDFGSIVDAKIFSPECGVWVVRSYVDAENSFGAKIRTRYEATVHYVGDHEWRLRDLKTW